MNHFTNYKDITDGIDVSIWKAIERAINKNSKESFSVLSSFVRDVLLISIKNNSPQHFHQYIFFPAYYYKASYKKITKDLIFFEIHKFCSEEAARLLKEVVLFYIDAFYQKQQDPDQVKFTNKFYYMAFEGFSRLLYYIVKNQDVNQFRYTIKELEQIPEKYNNQFYQIESDILELKRLNLHGESDDEIKSKEKELDLQKQFNNYKRHVILGIRYWILFLFQVGKLDEDIALQFLSEIETPYAESDDVLRDVLFFQNIAESYTYMGWYAWDYAERQSGEVYSLQQPHQWMISGFFIDQIRERSFFMNINKLDTKDISQASNLYETLKQYSQYLEGDFEKWKSLLSVEDIETYKIKSNEVLKDFAFLKRKVLTDIDKSIVQALIHKPHVTNFKSRVGNTWESHARVHKIFKSLGSSSDVSDQEIELKQIGRRLFYEKAKVMFVEENYQQIYGVERIGAEVGLWEDNFFLRVIRQTDHHKVNASNVLDAITESILDLKKREVKPNFILMSHRHSYRDDKFLKSELFKSKHNTTPNNNDLESFYLGEFDGIPVYTSLSELLNNFVLVCDFKNSFQQLYKTNEDWFDKELKVDVELVSEERAERELTENYAKWTMLDDGDTLTREEALQLIQTSVIVDIGVIVDYIILNKGAYVLGYIKTS